LVCSTYWGWAEMRVSYSERGVDVTKEDASNNATILHRPTNET